MDEATFSKLLVGQLFKEPLQLKPRAIERKEIHVEVLIVTPSTTYTAQLVDCSPHVMRINLNIPLTTREACTVVFKTTPPLELVCLPIIGEQEFQKGGWNRLKIKSVSIYHRLQGLTKQKTG